MRPCGHARNRCDCVDEIAQVIDWRRIPERLADLLPGLFCLDGCGSWELSTDNSFFDSCDRSINGRCSRLAYLLGKILYPNA